MYDLVIRNGTVVDGTGADRFAADIAVTTRITMPRSAGMMSPRRRAGTA